MRVVSLTYKHRIPDKGIGTTTRALTKALNIRKRQAVGKTFGTISTSSETSGHHLAFTMLSLTWRLTRFGLAGITILFSWVHGVSMPRNIQLCHRTIAMNVLAQEKERFITCQAVLKLRSADIGTSIINN
jgi:hypothetical protein